MEEVIQSKKPFSPRASYTVDNMRDKTKYLIKRCADQSLYENFKISDCWLGNFMERYH